MSKPQEQGDRQELPYRRRPGTPEFGPTRVLDLAAMRRRWQPWVDLGCDELTHVIIKHTHMVWHHTMRADRDDLLARPWTSLLTACGLRPFVLAQLRVPNRLDERVPDAGGDMSELRARWAEWLYGPDPLRRLQVTSLLGTMTIHMPVEESEDPDPTDPDPIVQHLRYARAGVLHQRYPRDQWNADLSVFFARNATEAVLRTGATVRAITHELRVTRHWESAKPWIEHGYAGLEDLAEHPRWLAALAESKFHRCVALYHFRRKESDKVAETLRASYACDEVLRAEAGDNPVIRHLWMENRRTLLESTIKNQIGHDPAGVAAEIAELDGIEPNFYESRYFIGELFARAGRIDEAAAHFEASALGGAGRGAMSAFRAFEAYREIGDDAAAQRCLDLAHDLDPMIDLDEYRPPARTVVATAHGGG